MTTNPLLVPIDSLIDYPAIQPEHIEQAVDQLLALARQAVDTVSNDDSEPSWDNIVEPITDATETLYRAWSVAGHLNSVINTPELRTVYNQCLPRMSEFSTWVGLNRPLFLRYQALADSPAFAALTPQRQRIITLALRDFRLSGVQLEGQARDDYARISEELAQTSQQFSEHVLDAIDQWHYLVTDQAELDGIPDDVLAAAQRAAQENDQQGWRLTLKMPCYLPVMQYARNQTLRELMYRAYTTIASDQGDTQFDNSQAIETLLNLRAQEASLLGFASYAHMRLETRMADTPEQVMSFLRDLAAKARPYARQDLDELQAFAQKELGLETLQAWDVPFSAERLREQRYAYSEDEVKQYFTEPAVLSGLFKVIQRLFDVTLRAADAPVWHPAVRPFEVMASDGKVLGYLYMDLHARQGKQGGAWVDSERSRRRLGEELCLPIAYLVCNFAEPQPGRPALLTHDDVITLFHESGHALHTLLSRVDDPAASAFSAVEWDAIELPSQFMENFCWEWPVVQMLTAHVETGEHLPRALYNKLNLARNFQSGMQMVRQLEFSLFDMLIHSRDSGLSIDAVMEILDQVRQEVAVLFPPEWHRFPHQFSHLFAGGYGAGYYSYKWAEVLSADAYSAFEEKAYTHSDGARDTLDSNTGHRFWREILSVGGERPAADSFRAFRGRDPSITALLRHSGLTPEPA
ncbi:M3 family metallopeptidase [Alcaligenes faecalis]|uniref:M3 family metallopeptidase n=1 Tax=Alcaligenes faecalis TaxID=511 RepID=UPI0005AA97F2|nr:M3 family metallopeptidase [Alcaligenes faecalis]ATH99805.1 oligopeptidase A [Alcaligenes faecalis]AYZ92592.1 M3 family peptidase [Alcaligenes faecalis]MCX5593353.1 M3 family metallopeptidase [Alcaligenes faecalis]QQC31600.1 M3 family metallopeptidase [Alcaligenes faecalis]CAJ0904811.1 Oligopeptidase A [Alcaligenes faecalis subsp. faecalis]